MRRRDPHDILALAPELTPELAPPPAFDAALLRLVLGVEVGAMAAASAPVPIPAAPPPGETAKGEAGGDAGPEGQRFLSTRPADASFNAQWHLHHATAGANLRDVWADYAGRGVKVAVIDDGFDHTHADLRANYALNLDHDWRAGDADARNEAGNNHGTAVMGVIGADLDGRGAVGVAHDATLAGLRVGFGAAGNPAQLEAALRDAAQRFDVVNSSWGYSSVFADDFNNPVFAGAEAALAAGTALGRGGLGTSFVFSAGNARAAGDNVNHHNHQNSLHTIAVGATDSAGRVASFSTPGAAILVSAPGVAIATTDATGAAGYVAGDLVTVSGTSFSAPVVAGIVALMLDANAALGWRDIQEILAISSRQTDAANATWRWNGAKDWNGGGMHTSTDFGFGLVDAHAAVRLAETWGLQGTSANLARVGAASAPGSPTFSPTGTAIADGGTRAFQLTLAEDLRIDRIEVGLDLRHTWRGDIRVTLVSPTGTESVLPDRPGGAGSAADNIVFDLGSTQFWGEGARGTWTLRVQDLAANRETGWLAGWRLDAWGDAPSADTTYVYTNEFAALGAQAGRRLLTDLAGTDTVNASAVTTASTLDLATGLVIAGRAVGFASGTVIERAFAGDGNDAVRGNAAANWLWGGRGDDVLAGRAGADVFAFGARSGRDVIEDFSDADDIWLMDGVGVASLAGNVARLSDGATITASNGWQWTVADFVSKGGWLV